MPYISYIHNAFAETTNSVRVAWPTHFVSSSTLENGTNTDHTFTGKWEVMTVPAMFIPLTDEMVSSGVPTETGGWAAPRAGITSATLTNTVYPDRTALRGYTSATGTQAYSAGTAQINQTMLIGYMTERWYEGAVLKYNIVGSLPNSQ